MAGPGASTLTLFPSASHSGRERTSRNSEADTRRRKRSRLPLWSVPGITSSKLVSPSVSLSDCSSVRIASLHAAVGRLASRGGSSVRVSRGAAGRWFARAGGYCSAQRPAGVAGPSPESPRSVGLTGRRCHLGVGVVQRRGPAKLRSLLAATRSTPRLLDRIVVSPSETVGRGRPRTAARVGSSDFRGLAASQSRPLRGRLRGRCGPADSGSAPLERGAAASGRVGQGRASPTERKRVIGTGAGFQACPGDAGESPRCSAAKKPPETCT